MENSLIFYQILSNRSLGKYVEISLENFYVDIGLGEGWVPSIMAYTGRPLQGYLLQALGI